MAFYRPCWLEHRRVAYKIHLTLEVEQERVSNAAALRDSFFRCHLATLATLSVRVRSQLSLVAAGSKIARVSVRG